MGYKNILLLLTSTTFCLFFFEVGLRLIYKPKVYDLSDYIQRNDNPNIKWEHIPNISKNIDVGIKFKISINSFKFRTTRKITSLKKAPRKNRILLIGDSVAEGYGVDDEYIFSEIINNTDDRFKLLNSATAGYNTLQQKEYLFTEGVLHEPDTVILGFCFNDIASGSSLKFNFQTGQEIRFQDGFFPRLNTEKNILQEEKYKNINQWIYYNIFSYRILSDKINYILNKLGLRSLEKQYSPNEYDNKPIEGGHFLDAMADSTSVEFLWFRDKILNINDFSKENNFKLIVVIFPLRSQMLTNEIDHVDKSAQNNLKSMLVNNGISFLDALDTLSSKKDFIDFCHLSNKGHEKIANWLLKSL